MKNQITMDAAGVSQMTGKIEITEKFLLNAMTSVGYEPKNALDELIDNSFDAGAQTVLITLDNDFIRISDNGCGMSRNKLIESMSFGVEREYDEFEIGYFGTGMKTGILNLLKLNEPHKVTISTYDGNEFTKLEWFPGESVFDFHILDGEYSGGCGTRIEIEGAKKIQPGSYKTHLGVYFYPTLKDNIKNIHVNNDLIKPMDPLYRESPEIQENFVQAKVCDEIIDVKTVLLSDVIDKHSWDNNGTGWSYSKSGVYLMYGGRYINAGGTLNVVPNDPWFSKTRMEINVPKSLTKEFGIPFNKSEGISKFDSDKLDDLRHKIKDMFNWGRVARKKDKSNINDEETQKLVKQMNKAANKAGLVKPKVENPDEKKMVQFEAKKKPKVDKPKRKNITESIIRENKLFDIMFDDLGSIFWQVGYVKNRFNIIINNCHPFYLEIYQKMDTDSKYHMLNFMGSMALAQYETLGEQSINGVDIMTFWEEYWYNFSKTLTRLIKNS